MKILTSWLRHYLPTLTVSDRQLADDLTLRGIAVEGVHDLGPGNGHLFEMDITTNRVDAMNHYGIAREAATIYNLPLAPLDAMLVPVDAAKCFPVRIEAPEVCGRFTAQVLRGVTLGQSTGQVAEFFTLLGQKQISNAVDASNFVLLGMGQPTHAFDLDKIEGGIVVRLAHKGEKIKLLDGSERVLEADDLVIADEVKALSLAGVMGGWDSMITPETKNILVEAAWFDPASIRRSSRRHGFHTDASHRFERGADFNSCAVANALVSALILQHGGQAEGEMVDVIVPEMAAMTAARPAITVSVKQVQRHLGTTIAPEGITKEIVAQYLTALGCELTPISEDVFAAKLPSWRLDLEREIDLVEEIARVYGYNGFANTLPTPGVVVDHPTAAAEAAVRVRLLSLGFSESVSSTFASQAESDLFYTAKLAADRTVPMENPLSEEASLLRPSLVPGMVSMLAHNLNRDVREVRLFEQGQRFTGTVPADASFISEVHEAAQLSLGLTGAGATTAFYTAQDPLFYELKGVVESLLSLFTLTGGKAAVTFSAEAPVWLEAGRCATALLNGQPIAYFGELAHAQREARKLRQPVYLAELDLARLYALPLKKVTAHELSRYQAVERDFSLVFPDAVQWHTIAAAIEALAIPELQSLKPVEIWRDAKKYPGVYSLLVRTVFQSNDRTLTEEELTGWQAAIITALTGLGGVLRGAAAS
jgi:phenylalanyl-tRNA synthetase beta chain